MKVKILNALETKYKDLGATKKVLEQVAEYLTKFVTTDEAIEDVVGGAELMLKAFQSEADKVRGEKSAMEKKLKELEDKGGHAGQPQPGKSQPKEDEVPAWAKGLIDEVKSLRTEKVATSRKSEIEALVKDIPNEVVKKQFLRMDVSGMSAEDFEAYKNEIKADSETLVKEFAVQGASFGRPSGGMGQSNHKTLTEQEEADFLAVYKPN